jgi:hypothetical protein
MRLLMGAITLASLAGAPLHAQADAILGTWRGTSICVREDWNGACNDEQVIYYVTRAPNQPDSIALDAQKVVGGKPEPMGILSLGYDAAARTWAAEWRNARYHILWTYQVSGDVLTGTLFQLPSRRVARHVNAHREQP